MQFLVTNDDGIQAPGIRTLSQKLTEFGDVIVVAPDQEKSGTGHAITVHRPLRIAKVPIIPQVEECYMIDGTPADCMKMAIQGMKIKPDMIISGINIGANLGTDVLYSGTVSAAIEGVILGIPSVAISLCGDENFLDTAIYFLSRLLFEIKTKIPSDGLLNINVPATSLEQVKGLKVTKLSLRLYENEFEERLDPKGRPYYWMKGKPIVHQHGEEYDHIAVEKGYVSVTPIHFDLTYHELLEQLKKDIE